MRPRFRARKVVRLGPIRFNFTERGFSSWGLKIGPWTWNAKTGRHSVDTPGPGGISLELVALVAYRPGVQGRGSTGGREMGVETTVGNPRGAGTGRTRGGPDGQRPTVDLRQVPPGAGKGGGSQCPPFGEGSELVRTPTGEGCTSAGTPDLDPPDAGGTHILGTPAPGSTRVQPGPTADDRVAELIADGAGRRTIARELSISEHAARELLAERRNGHGAVA